SFSPPSCCLFSLLLLLSDCSRARWRLPSFPTRRSSDLDMRGGAALLRHLPLDVPDAVGDGLGVQDHPAAAPVGVVVGLLLAVEGDRKSTRLNSSHVSISYAVFCLKKKSSKAHNEERFYL